MNLSAGFFVAAFFAAAGVPLQASPIFNYIPGTGVAVGDQVYNAFVAAGNRWSAVLSDNVTINVQINFESLSAGVLGDTESGFVTALYSTARTDLVADAKTATDATVVANLPAGPALSFAINHTADCGNCTTPYLDNNANNDNTHVDLTRAEAKAVGLLGPSSAQDGSITFSSNFSYDFDPSNGITPGAYDFVGIATHEIGHLLGFVSSVDDYDFCGASLSNCGGATAEAADEPTVLDLFRYSNPFGTGYIMDQSADNRPKFFSIDGGATLGPVFSNGVNFGDGAQASHWKDNLGIGIMDPTVAPGELMAITQNDITALDAIGWDAVTVPEPFTSGLMLMGILAVAALRRKHSLR